MGKLLKWLFGLLVAVVVLVAAAVVILPMVIDPNDYKPQIVNLVKERTGRDLAIREPLALSVFPSLAVRLGGVSLSNAPGFGEEPFAEIDALDLRVGVMPLLDQRIEVDTVVLKGLALRLERKQDGQANWDDLAAPADEPAAEPPSQEDGPGSAGFQFAVNGVKVEDAKVVWDDRQAGQRVVVEDVRLVTGALAPGEAVPVEAGLKLTVDQPRLELAFGLDGTIAIGGDVQRFESDGLGLSLTAKGEGLPEDGIALEVETDLLFDQAAGRFSLTDLSVSGPQIDIDGEVNATGLADAKPEIDARLALQQTNLKNLLGAFGIVVETTDPQAMTRLSGNVALSMAGGGVNVDPLALTLDDTNIRGVVRVPNFDGPVIRADFTVDAVDVDRYLPPPSEATAGQPAQPAGEPASTGAADPFAALRTLDLEARATVGQLKINNVRMSDVQASVTSKNGVLRIDPAAAKLYEGTFNGLVEFDARKSTPRLRAKPTLTGIQVGQLLADLAGEDRLVGTGEVAADISLEGLTEAQIRQSLNGTGRFAFRNGALKGINLAQLIRQAKAQLGMGPQPPDEPQQTDFTELGGSVNITNGVIRNQDLKALSPLLRISGAGTVDLPANTIDYRVTTEIVQSLEGQGGLGGDELAGVPIPVRLTGSLTDPTPTVDLESVVKARAQREIEARKEEVQQKVEEKAKKEIGRALEGLFGR